MPDVFGQMVRDYYRDELTGQPVYHRDDGERSPAHCAWYFAGPAEWGAFDRDGIARSRGTVLDVGCGVGRSLRWLAGEGHDTVGLDASPGAVRVARARGTTAVLGDMEQLPIGTDRADTALFVGTHVGAVETEARLRSLVQSLDEVLRPGGRIVADMIDPTVTEQEDLREYLTNRWQGTGVATRRFRLEYNGQRGAWRTLLMCSPDALARILEPTVWTCSTVDCGEGTRYYFVLERA
jgi:SAM-dependent methyltransferase